MGWVGANHPKDYFGEAQVEISKIWAEKMESIETFRMNRKRIRALTKERKRQVPA